LYASFLYFLKRIVFVKRHVWFFRIYNLRFKVDNSLRLANDSTATTRGGDNNMMFELYTEKKSVAGGNGGDGSDDDGKGDGGEPGGGSGGGEAPDPAA
ncbi:hypothetical protein ABHZ97_19875, partial [Bacteroides ovatus]